MAKVIDSPGGSLNGKLGGMVYYQVGGKTYARKAPSKQTKAQKQKVSGLKKMSQDKMAMTQRFLRPLTRIIAFGYQELAEGARRPYHAAVSYTKANCFVQEKKGFYIDPSLFKISRGSLSPPDAAEAAKTEKGFELSWSDNSWISSARPSDCLFILLYNPESGRAVWEFSGNTRESRRHLFPLRPDQLIGQWHVYLAFSRDKPRSKTKILSDSVYLGKF